MEALKNKIFVRVKRKAKTVSILTPLQKEYIDQRMKGATKKDALENIGVGDIAELREPIVEVTLLDKMKEKQNLLLDGITVAKVAYAPLKDIVGALSIITDKVRLQEGKSTQNILHGHTGKILMENPDDARIKRALSTRLGVKPIVESGEAVNTGGSDDTIEESEEEDGDLS